jgi:hypothetical protein
MDKHIFAKQQMYGNVQLALDKAAELFADFPAMLALILNLKSGIKLLDDNIKKQLGATAGTPQAKSAARLILEGLLGRIAAGVYLYAEAQQMHELMAMTNLLPNAISHLTDPNLAHTGGVVADASMPVADNLGDYKITKEHLASLKKASQDFSKAKTAKEESFSDKRGAMTDVISAITVLDKVLNDMDRLMINFLNSDPGFYEAYSDSRIIPTVAVHHRKPDPTPEPPTPTPAPLQ